MKASATSDGTNGRFTVTPFTNPSGAVVYRVQGRKRNGARIRANYPTQTEAEAERQRLTLEYGNQVASVRLEQTTLTPPQLRDAEWAFSELGDKPMRAAVRFYLDNYRAPVTSRTVLDAFDEFMIEKEAENARPQTIRNLRVRVGRFVKVHGGRLVSDVQPDQIRAAMFTKGRSPVSIGNERRALSGFFTWAAAKDYAPSNPVEKVTPPTVDDSEPEILALSECRKLMQSAVNLNGGALVPFVTLALFAAVRPMGEMRGLSWDNIDLNAGTVTVRGPFAKLRGRRVVELSANAIAWLRPHAIAKTPLYPKNWRRQFDALKKSIGYGGRSGDKSGLKPYPQDLLRHTAISNHFAHHGHEGETASWAGNSPTMVHRHYKGLVSKQDAAAFWAIAPDRKRTVKMNVKGAPAVTPARA